MDESIHIEMGTDGNAYMFRADWSDTAYMRFAAQLSTVLGLHITVLDSDDPDSSGYHGFRVKDTRIHYIEVHAMIVNWRVARVPKSRAYPVPDRFWCYAGIDMASLIVAVQSAAAWDGADDTEPQGWTKNGQTGEVRL